MPLVFSPGRDADTRRLVTLAGALVVLLLLVRTAWICDDSYITFRTVDNALHGYGWRWNAIDRVQTFTHPLWFLVMLGARAVTGDVYYTAIALSIAITLAVVVLLGWSVAQSAPAVVFAYSVLALSRSFIEFSTSGLENALTNLLLLAFFLTYAQDERHRRRVLTLALWAALIMLNRIDAGLLVLPALAVAAWRHGVRRSVPAVALGFLPLVAWEVFSVIYYGFLVPNTAYAKLGTGVPHSDLFFQGGLYFLDAINSDPVTLLVIAGALISPLLLGGWVMPAGIAVYLVYILWIGGDLMTGRFFSAPLLCAVVHLLRRWSPAISFRWAGAMALVWLAGVLPGWPTNFSGATYGRDMQIPQDLRPTAIDDQRRLHFPQTGLLTAHRGVTMPNHHWLHVGYDLRRSGQKIYTTGYIGLVGYGAGPRVYVLDRFGLGDGLLARLPSEGRWEIGHCPRRIPEGYEESILTGRNRIKDPAVAAYYERLRTITEGPIWTRRRFLTILRMNLGEYDHFVADYGLVRVSLDAISSPRTTGTAWDDAGNIQLTPRGLEVAIPDSTGAAGLELSVSNNDRYTVEFLDRGEVVRQSAIAQPNTPGGALITHTVPTPDRHFDAVRIRPAEGDFRYSVGHVRLLSPQPR